ncbi:mitochondrial ribosomal large subunit component [Actinomortierella ambigua]|uniref:Mitochondrial ribosomal large subunit component n=1 Tax=Actinomortierella ambigua TaxID=1343610 RepID=A0A9P6QHS0_9FUNG|nr:mitochondrial ribosomal large subunit component [Actinomortierella ambigua]
MASLLFRSALSRAIRTVAATPAVASTAAYNVQSTRHISFAHGSSLQSALRQRFHAPALGGSMMMPYQTSIYSAASPLGSATMRSLGSPANKTQRRFNSLQPKRMKYRKKHKGKIPIPIGGSTKGTYVEFGDYGLRIKDGCRMTAKQIQSAHTAIKRKIKTVKGSQIWTRVFPDIPVTSKGGEARMGKGKGSVDYYATRVGINRIIFEIGGGGLRREHAKEALRLAAAKMPVPTEFVIRADIVKPPKVPRPAPGATATPKKAVKPESEVTLGVYHKLSDHETFEKRGEIVFDTENWASIQYTPLSTTPKVAEILAKDFKLNLRAAGTGRYPTDDDHEDSGDIEYADLPKHDQEHEDQEVVVEDQHEQEHGSSSQPHGEEDVDPAVRAAQELYMKGAAQAQAKGPGSAAFYQIKLKDESRKWEALSSVKSCLLVASDFNEEITLHLDANRRLYGFDYYTSVDTCTEESQEVFQIQSLDQFNHVKLDVAVGQTAPRARYARAQTIKLDETGKPEAEKSFWQKYWMYIVPALLMFLMAGSEPEQTKPAAAAR